MNEVYVNGLGCISAQNTFDRNWFFADVKKAEKNFFKADELSFKNSIPANIGRRMSKIIRMGVASAMSCMKDAGVENISAIVAGTGMGCFEDSEKFLRSMTENEEKLVSPATFIQSTHNTLAAQIALLLKCHEYNFTYVHRGFSFESALQDAALQIEDDKSKNILVGGADEITPAYLDLLESTGRLKKQNSSEGIIAGEGSAFFLLSGIKSASCYARVKAIKTIYKPRSPEELQTAIYEFLSLNEVPIPGLSAVIVGLNGDAGEDSKIISLNETYFKNTMQLSFKNFFGESPVTVSFALWIAAKLIKKKQIPEILCINDVRSKELKNVIIFNQYRDTNYSLVLVSEC
jgi:3-oxoacyl-[acyl-carrier-protein] synthase II